MSDEPLVKTEGAVLSSPANAEDRQFGLFAHLGGILGFPIPLIIWLIKKDRSQFVDDQAKESLNFQLMMLIGHVIAAVTMPLFGIGVILWLILFPVNVVFCILAGMAANRGEAYRYPVNIRLVK